MYLCFTWNLEIFDFRFSGNVVWLDDRTPTKVLLDLTRPIRELKHITSVVNNDGSDEDGELNENLNDDHMDQDDVRAYLHFECPILIYYL